MRPATSLALLLLFALAGPSAAAAAEVTAFSPLGTVKRVRQVTARFSEPMVPLGDPRAPDPFDVACPEPGRGRWVDSRDWVYDFDRDLPAGVRCAFRLRPGYTTLGGAPLGGRQEFAFSTGGPAVLSSTPREGDRAIDEEQAFILVLDAEPTPASLLAHVAFAVEGLPEPVGVRVLTGEARAAILRTRYRGTPPPTVLVLQARQRFPNDAKVSLVWGRGVATASGVASEQDQVLPFQVRSPFTATFHCERERRQSGCVPVTPMTVQFSAPVARDAARAVAIAGPGGRRWAPDLGEEGAAFVRRVGFKGPFPDLATYRVELPAALQDDAGRPLANAGAFPLTVRTEAFPPLAKFAARFGIVEKADATLPVTLRNLEREVPMRTLRVDRKPGSGGLGEWVRGTIFRVPPELSDEILPWLRRVRMAHREASVFDGGEPSRAVRSIGLPKPSGARPFEVVGIPLGAPGLYVVELESPRLGAALLGKPQPMYVPTAALVTNLSLHFKWGREASLAWVTALDTGRPVAGARVTIQDCRGQPLWKGAADGQGTARIPGLPIAGALPRCPWPDVARRFPDWSQTQALVGLDEGLFVLAQTADDLTFVHSGLRLRQRGGPRGPRPAGARAGERGRRGGPGRAAPPDPPAGGSHARRRRHRAGHDRPAASADGLENALATLALDPDIPPARQRIVFEMQGPGARLRWMLDGGVLGSAGEALAGHWSPGATRCRSSTRPSGPSTLWSSTSGARRVRPRTDRRGGFLTGPVPV